MKWIKLFEKFENDMLDDTKDILRLHLGEYLPVYHKYDIFYL